MPDFLSHQAQVLGSTLASTLTLWRGTNVLKAARQPPKVLELYDIEASPPCRAVREVLTALGLDVTVYPCPEGGSRYRPAALRLAAKARPPLLHDHNTGNTMHGSRTIVEYLFHTYGGSPVPDAYRSSAFTPRISALGSMLRGMRGSHARPSNKAARLLELWSFESSPYSRLVRERLCELELGYKLHNLGKEQLTDMGPAVLRLRPGPYKPKPGGKRELVFSRLGRVQLPYLEDPNTGTQLYESAAIIDYLEATYAA